MTTPSLFSSILISRTSQKNYELTPYSFNIRQSSPFEAASILVIAFPSNIVSNPNIICQMTSPLSVSLTCSKTAQNITVIFPNSSIDSNTGISISISNTRNQPSFQPADAFIFQTRTADNLFLYSSQTYTPSFSNSVPSTFSFLSFSFSLGVYG